MSKCAGVRFLCSALLPSAEHLSLSFAPSQLKCSFVQVFLTSAFLASTSTVASTLLRKICTKEHLKHPSFKFHQVRLHISSARLSLDFLLSTKKMAIALNPISPIFPTFSDMTTALNFPSCHNPPSIDQSVPNSGTYTDILCSFFDQSFGILKKKNWYCLSSLHVLIS